MFVEKIFIPMKLLIECPFELSDQDREMIESKMFRLDEYDEKITQAEVYFRLDDTTVPDGILAEVQLHVPGPVIYASAAAENAIEALNRAADKAKRQLLKAKEIRQDYNPKL